MHAASVKLGKIENWSLDSSASGQLSSNHVPGRQIGFINKWTNLLTATTFALNARSKDFFDEVVNCECPEVQRQESIRVVRVISIPFTMATVPEKGLDELLDERLKLQNASSDPRLDASQDDASLAGAALPPGMKRAKEYSVDELLKEMNRVPLFMTSLDDTDGENGENIELEALKALAYEGTRAEIAQNFREQGTELIRMEKRYREARDYYTKALRALKDPLPPPPPDQGPSVVEIDEEAEAEKERSIEEVCLVNRALCNLEMSITSL